jgi:hypothetical protein
MRARHEQMEKTGALSRSELLETTKENFVNKRTVKLIGKKKMESEVHRRTQKCLEIKLSLAINSLEHQSGTAAKALAEVKKLVAELEGKFVLIAEDFQEEKKDRVRQI